MQESLMLKESSVMIVPLHMKSCGNLMTICTAMSLRKWLYNLLPFFVVIVLVTRSVSVSI